MRLAVLLLAFGLAGCTHTRPADLSSAATRAEVNARAERGHPVLHLDGQRGRQVRSLHVAPDVTTWIDKKTGEARSAPTAEVRAVAFRRDGHGALQGIGIGVAVVGLLDTYLGALDGEGFLTFSPLQGAAFGAAGGAEIGALVGAIRSDRVVYETARCRGPVARCSE
ncbi:hypothetical protein [Rubrivirga marina]|uniref:Lipoprotein n=1 Tax=Rubrivirga marina TaxID=1196024 RepID=A0A271J5J3_9BACT|nr:hypothetical protein [Rubrivirga marina]PAP78235.1 hypothetical protein BSZ37_18285 [Rubrivirga marina]